MLLILTTTLCLSLSAIIAPATDTPAANPLFDANGRVVAIVRVKAPWYAFDFLLSREYRKTIPTYKAVKGLRFKAFSSIETGKGKFFGGIYLWETATDARQWFTPAWFADVEKKRGAKPDVVYMPVVADTSFVAAPFAYGPESEAVTVVIQGISPALSRHCLAKQPGLWRTYIVTDPAQTQGAVLLFASAREAKSFLATQAVSRYDWYTTPVLLNNVPE